MTNRENMLRALRRDNPERVPFEIHLCPSQQDNFEKYAGTRDYYEYFGVPFRYVWINPTKRKTDFSIYYNNLTSDAKPLDWNWEWGIYGISGSFAHFQEILSPMANFESIEQINKYPFPDFGESYRWEGVSERVKETVRNDFVTIGSMEMTIFETAWQLRGMENFLADLVLEPEFAEVLLDKVTEIRIRMAENFAKADIDILKMGDDVSTQLDMMMNPDTWRTLLKPRLAKVIKAAKDVKPEILVFYHGDGNLEKIIPDLIEIGVDILNPIQPECMDPVEIKRLYGDRLSFWGALGTQTTLPFGTPEEVREKCKSLIDTVGKGGGLLLAPTHVIEPEVPWENILAYIETVKEYGKYNK